MAVVQRRWNSLVAWSPTVAVRRRDFARKKNEITHLMMVAVYDGRWRGKVGGRRRDVRRLTARICGGLKWRGGTVVSGDGAARRTLTAERQWRLGFGLGFLFGEDDAVRAEVSWVVMWQNLIGSLISARMTDVASSGRFDMFVEDCHVA
ncbi:hypothetical protein LR48_Vigan530s000800 [Vigna angularis]|uniref:Uncharacterized protein n=1 Tax=Phaseolus angularis TaxID=3914 RepID=A0A0L9TD73_PHAAN|nr:hypothetical protein LR48_Vigan530s000800 [Vigna angularis]